MSNIPHYLRLKPRGDSVEAREAVSLIETQDETHVKFKDTASANKFTKIFDNVSQLDLYTQTLQDLTVDTLENKDSVFFTLGPSNSGKSYSIYGDGSNPGVAIYSLNEIFNKINGNFADYKALKRHFGENFIVSSNAQKNCTGEYGLSLSVFEIYNDRIRDLTQDSSKTVNQSLDIITDAKDGKIKPNKIRQIFVANLDEAKLVIHKSVKRRAVSSTNLNQTSSRSHLFIYFNLHKVTGTRTVKTSRLTIADLAGSERTKTAKTEGKEFKEGNYTNTSLTELGRCLALMKSKKFDRSLLRTNKLTRLLLSDLFGNFNQNRIKILLTLDPYSTLSTILHALRYIQPVSRVTINSERNSVEPESEQVLLLSEDVRLLKEQNGILTREIQEAKQALTTQEIDVRQELSEEYESKIRDLDIKHTTEMNSLKDQHQSTIDQRLDLLSKDYEEKLEQKESEFQQKIKELNEKYEELDAKYTESSNNLTNETNNIDLTEKYEAEMINLKKAHQNHIDELMVEKSKLERQLKQANSELETQVKQIEDLKSQLEAALKDAKHIKKKNKKLNKEVEELNDQIGNKRKKSDDSESEQEDKDQGPAIKKRKSEEFRKIELKSPSEDDSLAFSPIKLSRSPSKDKSLSPFKKSKSPSKKKKSTESPKKQPLQDSLLENTLPSPKIKVKSPSKGKKKLQKVRIIDESFSD